MGKIAEQALPLVRNVIEAVIYAVFPFVFLLFLLAQGPRPRDGHQELCDEPGVDPALAPLYAILNYVATLASAQPRSRGEDGNGRPGPGAETAASIYSGAVSDQAIAGYMVISIPIIATAIIRAAKWRSRR